MDEQTDESEMSVSLVLGQDIDTSLQPSAAQVQEKALELGIDDLQMARISLIEQVSAEWRIYLTRNKDLYYISLDSQQAYTDHPIDMKYKRIYAQQHNLAVPSFPHFPMQQVVTSAHLIQRETERYFQELNVVYEESEEEEPEAIDDEQLMELKRISEEQLRKEQKQMEQQIEKYREGRIQEIGKKQEAIEMGREKQRRKRLAEIERRAEEGVAAKNKQEFAKNKDRLRQEYATKIQKLTGLQERQYEMQRSVLNKQINREQIKLIYREKLINTKTRLIQQTQKECAAALKQLISRESAKEINRFNSGVKIKSRESSAYQLLLSKNNQQINNEKCEENHKRRKIFSGGANLEEKEVKRHTFLIQDYPFTEVQMNFSRKFISKPSLALRLFKKLI